MSLADRLRRRSTLTGLGAVLFTCGVVALFAALFRDAVHGERRMLWAVALCILAAAAASWIAAAHWASESQEAERAAEGARRDI